MIPRVQAIVELIERERRRFADFCRSLSEEELARPVPSSTWIVKDFISHLATIDRPVGQWFVSIVDGSEAPRGGDSSAWNVDRFNDAAVARRRGQRVEEILAEAEKERVALVEILARVTDEQFDRSIRFGGDSKRPPSDLQFGRYLSGWARHDIIHVSDMLRALPERRADPLVAAWLAEPEVAVLVSGYQKAMA